MTPEPTTTNDTDLQALLTRAGFDLAREVPPPDLVTEVATLAARAREDPLIGIQAFVRARRALEVARNEGTRAAKAALKLEALLKNLLGAKPLCCRVERVIPGAAPKVVARVRGEMQELPLHPSVPPAEILGLEPWDHVSVHPTEALVLGIARDPEGAHAAQGEIVEVRGWQDQGRGLVRVTGRGAEERVVRLAPALRDLDLAPRARLVLLHGDDRWAIAVAPSDSARSRFEVPVESLTTTFDDLADLDAVIERLVEGIVLSFVRDDLGARFGLEPLRGALLCSWKPGMGKTALARALARWLRDAGRVLDFDVALYQVKPSELKNKYHGEDGRIIREELFGSLAARERERTRALIQLVVFDEVDSLGRRAGGDDGAAVLSPAQNDGVTALLAELDGLVQRAPPEPGRPKSSLVVLGLTNRPDLLDEALKRPGRFGDLVIDMPGTTRAGAEAILAVHARGDTLPWFVDGAVHADLAPAVVRERCLRPAIDALFDAVALRYSTDGRTLIDVRAGEALSSVHFMAAMNGAKRRAARRAALGLGVPAIRAEDVREALCDEITRAARQLEADRAMLARQLRVPGRIVKVEVQDLASTSVDRFVRARGVA